MNFEVLKTCICLLENDNKLNVWHQALMSAILHISCLQKQEKLIRVSRRKLMALSHIATIPTYHKYFRELQDMGFLR